MSLYRKYRPQSFSHLVGQDHIKDTLMNELKHGHLTHAYLFAGPRGTGKTSTARLIAKSLNCTNRSEEGEPCETCEFCVDITEGRLIDVIEIDAASNRSIDEIRDLREKIKFAPTRAKNKLYIIDEVHMLTKDAFNALLKTLEEPPPNVYFILCTTEIHKIPETIISRCQRFDFKRIDVKTLMTRLSYIAQEEGIDAEDTAIELVARNVQGGLRDAISLFEQMVFDGKLQAAHIKEHLGIAGHETVGNLVNAFLEKNIEKALRMIQSVHNEGYDLASFQREILEFLREKLMEEVAKEKSDDISLFLRMIEILMEVREDMKYAPLPQLPLEIATLKICLSGNTSRTAPPQKTEAASSDVPFFKKLMGEKKEVTEKATEEETKTAKHMEGAFNETSWDEENIRHQWPRILDELQPPSLRRSLATARLTGLEDETVTFTFVSQFHLQKTNIIENKAKLESAFQKVFGKKPKFQFLYEKVALSDISETKGSLKKKTESSEKLEPIDDLAKKALDIFGGEEI